MNRHILTVIDHQLNPGKYTQEELEENSNDAYEYSEDAAAYADADAAAHAAYAAADAAYWLNEYFRLSGENKQDYIDSIIIKDK